MFGKCRREEDCREEFFSNEGQVGNLPRIESTKHRQIQILKVSIQNFNHGNRFILSPCAENHVGGLTLSNKGRGDDLSERKAKRERCRRLNSFGCFHVGKSDGEKTRPLEMTERKMTSSKALSPPRENKKNSLLRSFLIFDFSFRVWWAMCDSDARPLPCEGGTWT